jgi:hypothetical protein
LIKLDNKVWEQKLNYSSPVDLFLWKLKRFFNPCRKLLSIPPIYHENGVVYTAGDKSNVFAQHLSSFPESFITTQEEGPWYEVTSILDLENLYFTSCEEIIDIINSLKTKKAAGLGGLSNLMHKHFTTKAIV